MSRKTKALWCAEPLYDAARAGDLVAVKALLEAGANAKAKDYQGATLLHMAVLKGKVEIIKASPLAGRKGEE